MPTLTMTKGLPACGKTTWTKEEVLQSNGTIKRVNKDDLRAMIDASLWSKKNEAQILQIRDTIIRHFLSSGFSVIVDDTNLSPKHEETLEALAAESGVEFVTKSFLDVSLATCILRNAKRENPVPENTIRSMYNSFIRKKGHVAQYVPPPYNPELPDAIICDIDGTLAHMTGRSPYDYTRVGEDVVDPIIRNILRSYVSGNNIMDETRNYILIVSGRKDECREVTEKWLKDNDVPVDELHMRKTEDNRDDRIVKEEIYNEFIKDKYNVLFVLDDRDRVVNKWREMGLKCLQVAPGDF